MPSENPVEIVRFNQEGGLLAAGSNSDSKGLMILDSGTEKEIMQCAYSHVLDVDWKPHDPNTLAIAQVSSRIDLLDVRTGKDTVLVPQDPVGLSWNAVSWLNEHEFATGGPRVKIFDVRCGGVDDKKLVAIVSEDGANSFSYTDIIDAQTGAIQYTLRDLMLQRVAFSGNRLAVGPQTFDLRERKEIPVLDAYILDLFERSSKCRVVIQPDQYPRLHDVLPQLRRETLAALVATLNGSRVGW